MNDYRIDDIFIYIGTGWKQEKGLIWKLMIINKDSTHPFNVNRVFPKGYSSWWFSERYFKEEMLQVKNELLKVLYE